MKTTNKLHPGEKFGLLAFKRYGGDTFTFGEPGQWQALFVFRGQHCPICRSYLKEIEEHFSDLRELGISVAVVSADSEEQTRITAEAIESSFPLLYGMDEPTMQALGLYISEPRSSAETDHRFPEPGLFIVNPEGVLHLVDIANAPFIRPDIKRLVGGLKFIFKNDYPIRGTVA
ncbi:thioredoxin peroxidase [Acidihalobacter yilgarnensis]|uniref:Thioredoxin peroxidase n=1 Tax=Acidihalobacter yilgarnensis TaxID=2819280 RepID=A0A1D8INB4_9GAMM|nr:peroxiredoxin-like family protein [Acidihalobacter yilgarnensis]AOU97959.1 thioredoxin peroxidase [Acidihalobacter yilgarnensis]